MPDIRYKIWAEGYKDGNRDKQVIKSVIRAQKGMVLVFDDKGEQISRYQGQYEKVKPRILKDAPSSVVFSHVLDGEVKLKAVPREEW